MLDWYHSHGKNQTKTVQHFNQKFENVVINQPLVSKWLKDEGRIRKQATDVGTEMKRHRDVKFPQVETRLVAWINQCGNAGQVVSGEEVKEHWRKFARLEKIPSEDWLNLSGGWFDAFKKRHNLREFKQHGEAGSANKDVVKVEVARVRAIIAEYAPRDVFNMDETGLFYA